MKNNKLNEETIKSTELDNSTKKEKTIVKEWNSLKEYWDDWEKEEEKKNKKICVKIKDFFVYTIWANVSDWWYNFKWYFKNLKTFHKVLKKWRPWDYDYVTDLFTFSLEQLASYLENHGHEIEITRNKKIKAIRELVKEVKRDYESEIYDKYYDISKAFENNCKVTKYSTGSVSFDYPDDEARKKMWEKYMKALKKERKDHYDKIFKLIIGQSNETINAEIDKRISEANINDEKEILKMRTDLYCEIYDGSGYECWWD